MQGLPEAVSRPREVVADGARVEAGIDPAEQHAQPVGYDIVNRPAARRRDLFPGRAPGTFRRGRHQLEGAR